MNCRTAEGMINRYIDHMLSLKELEDFLEHISSCTSCYDELETYFIVHAAMQQLDTEDSEAVLDFRNLLEQDIKSSRRYIHKRKALHFFGMLGIILLIGLLIAFLIFVIFELGKFL